MVQIGEPTFIPTYYRTESVKTRCASVGASLERCLVQDALLDGTTNPSSAR